VTAAAESLWPGKNSPSSPAESDNCFQRVSDTVSGLWLAHSNRMAYGRPFGIDSPYPDDMEQTENLPYIFNANFPARSRGEYLYAAGLWVGGIKGNDTLVSHAFDYVAPVPELNPADCPEGSFQTGYGWADVEHVSVACDTIVLGDTLFRCQVGDCNDWYPLGIRVTSHSYTWESPPYDRSIIVEYTIQNIDSTPIEEGWVGIYADCDIGVLPDAHSDDISGFIDRAIDSTGAWVDLNIGYSIDMDGDPVEHGFDENSHRGVLGVQVLGLSVPDYNVNFNWWVIDRMAGYDWAPRKDDLILRDLGGSFAAAYGDSNKYFVMSSPEADYNQIESGYFHRGWVVPDQIGAEVAWGNDTRFVISAGPFDLAPSEEVTFTVAFVAGDNVISNPFINMWFDPGDPMSVSDYYELLQLDELVASGFAAASIFREGYHLPPPGPPTAFRLVEYDDIFATFVWPQKYAHDMAGYGLLKKTGNGSWEVVATNAPDDTTAVFDNLDPEITYSFAVASVDSGGAVGMATPSISLLPGLPHAPAIFKGTSHQMYPVLEWAPSIDSDIEFYRLYRYEAEYNDTVMLAQLTDTIYIDLGVAAAHTYEYFVTAVTFSEMESMPSSSVTLVPLTLISGILALNANRGNITSNLVFDLDYVDSLFARGLDGMGYTLRRTYGEAPLTIYDLSSYSLVIVSTENRNGALSENLKDILPVYLANGGKVILIIRHAGAGQTPAANPQVVNFGTHSFFSNYLMVDSSFIGPLRIDPGYKLVGDLVGAKPEGSMLPTLRWDSIKVNQFGYDVPNALPYCGYIWPREPAEIIYRYQAANPDSQTHNQINGIRYRGDDYQFYLLNFPLSLMEIDSAATLLRSAVTDLGEHFICGDINADMRFDIGDIVSYIGYLYRDLDPVNLMVAGDVDCNGTYDLADVMVLINFYSLKGLAPGCCQ
jgi:hypothetical protein